ncbi:lipopolysaccharide biosynthesis protein [Glutamicibacter sp. NPDC087344]|uniref:lipopolysaccharide biosynthesis protein n=1 Tax=Glutamicibacter sp. NPDC087344 TaxID=3363994 RepID=UPI003802F62C
MDQHRNETGKATKATAPSAGGAFGWSLANTLISRLGTLGIGIVLARVLGPEQFGTFAIALVALMAVLSFNELGVSLAIVRWPSDPALIFPTVNTLSLIGSTVFCAAAWFTAPAFTALMGDPEATPVVRLLILSVLINGAVAGPAALLQRSFLERPRMVIDQVNVWGGAVVSILLALLGMGAMALAIGRLVGGVLSGIMFLVVSPIRYRLGFDRQKAVDLLKFGLPLAGSSIVVFLVGYADQLMAGALLGTLALGFYVLAFNLSSWPLNIVSQPLRRVAPAVFAAVQHDPQRSQNTLRGLFTLVASVSIPIFAALAGAAEPLVMLIYGEVWMPAAAVLMWLVVAALARVFCELVYDYLVVAGRTSVVFVVQLTGLILLVPALWLGAELGGIVGLAAAQTIVWFAIILPIYLAQLRNLGVHFQFLVKVFWRPCLGGLATGFACFIASELEIHPLVSLALGGLFTLLVLGVLLWRQRGEISAIRNISRNNETTVTA